MKALQAVPLIDAAIAAIAEGEGSYENEVWRALQAARKAICELAYAYPAGGAKIIVFSSPGRTDHVIVETPLPNPMRGEETLSMKFEAPPGRGTEYVKRHFPSVTVEHIDLRRAWDAKG